MRGFRHRQVFHPAFCRRGSVAIKADHYEVLQKARIGQLAKEFRAKLGWLVGNMYSRIGTEDWSEPKERQAEQKKIVKQILEPEGFDNRPFWISRAQARTAERAGVNIRALTRANIVQTLSPHKPRPRVEVAATAAKEVLNNLMLSMSLASLAEAQVPSVPLDGSHWYAFLVEKYGSDSVGWPSLRDDVKDQNNALVAKFYTRLRNDPVFSASFK